MSMGRMFTKSKSKTQKSESKKVSSPESTGSSSTLSHRGAGGKKDRSRRISFSDESDLARAPEDEVGDDGVDLEESESKSGRKSRASEDEEEEELLDEEENDKQRPSLGNRRSGISSPRRKSLRVDSSFDSFADQESDRVGSAILRKKEGRRYRRTLSDPTGLSRSVEMSMSLDVDTELEPQPGSPFEEALRLQRSLNRKNKATIKRMERSRYERKKKKGEITKEHEQYNITYCMMLGIRYSVSQQSPVKVDKEVPHRVRGENRSLTIDDFMHVDRLIFDPSGSKSTPPLQLGSRFKFKDYAPEVFRQLRRKFGIDDRDYMLSLCGKYNYIEFISNSKSGQFFFYSNDGHYLIKTQSKAESKFMRQILARYYMYMSENEDSLLVKICGMHRVRLSHLGKNMHFVILKSVYSNAASRKIHTVYDLKGSTIGRTAKEGEAVYKDLDLIRNKQTFRLGPLKDQFLKQLEKDAKFLARLHIMDYSLLVGIHNKIAPPVAKSVAVLTGESSRTLGQYYTNTSARRLSGTLEKISPKQVPVDTRSFRSSTIPGVRQTKEWLSNYRAKRSSQELGPTKESGLSVPSVDGTSTVSDSPNLEDPMSPSSQSVGSSRASARGKFRAFELEDVDEYYNYDSDDDEPLPSHPDSKFSPVDSQDDSGKAGTEIYYFGVIDILQQYNTKKRAENIFKSLIEGSSESISSVNPRKYATRFVRFIREHVE